MSESQGFRQRSRGFLSRDRVASAAVEIIEREGLERLTMRRVAAELHSGSMSLYTHVRGRDDLLRAVVEQLVSELDTTPKDDETWQRAARRAVESYRALAFRYPRCFELLALAPDDESPIAEHLVRIQSMLRATGLTDEQAQRLLALLDAFATGFLMVSVRSLPTARGGESRSHATSLGPLRSDEMFEACVQAVLTGFAASL